jgi:hypothetical protein
MEAKGKTLLSLRHPLPPPLPPLPLPSNPHLSKGRRNFNILHSCRSTSVRPYCSVVLAILGDVLGRMMLLREHGHRFFSLQET